MATFILVATSNVAGIYMEDYVNELSSKRYASEAEMYAEIERVIGYSTEDQPYEVFTGEAFRRKWNAISVQSEKEGTFRPQRSFLAILKVEKQKKEKSNG
jgi:hypothetical protein|nr:MAG TPA: hypothetical protein [Herelleviridae sp.]